MFDGPVIKVTAEFLVGCMPEFLETFMIHHRPEGDITYRLVEWDQAGFFTAATPEGEAILREQARAALRDVLTEIGDRLEE